MNKIILTILIGLCITVTDAKAIGLDNLVFDSRVGLVDEFMKRFNANRPDSDSIEAGLPQIVTLFNVQNFSSETDPMYQIAVEFARDAIKSGTQLAYADTLWHAEATCEGKYKGRKVAFTLKLAVEPAGKEMYKWSICEASGDLFSLEPAARGKGFKIMPDDHETNFMSLHEITTLQENCILNYAARGFKPDPTTVFFTMVYDGSLKIDHVTSIDFIFDQVPGWSFTVRKFERESTNSGWLIDSLTRL